MQVYIDESGDSGLKGKPGSSRYFVIAAALFNDDLAARECTAGIRDVHRALNWTPRQEFKFNTSNHATRVRFFDGVAECDFRYIAAVVNKSTLSDPAFKNPDEFYRQTARLVLLDATPCLSEASVVMDKFERRDIRGRLGAYLKQRAIGSDGVSCIKSIRAERSHSCELVQLADMIAGAVARSFSAARKDAGLDRKLSLQRELVVRLWPR